MSCGHWVHGRLTGLDIESTGTDVWSDRIVTVTVVDYRPGRDVVAHSFLLDPGVEIPQGATDVHGITTEQAREQGRRPADVLPIVCDLVTDSLREGVPLVAYNAPFDLTMLTAELARHGCDPLPEPLRPVVDPMVLDKAFARYRRGKRTLSTVAEHRRVRLDAAHDATEDALAAMRLAWRLVGDHVQLQRMPLERLHDAQVAWRAQQQASLQEFFRSDKAKEKGSPGYDPQAVCDGSWPLCTRPEAVAS